MKIKIQRWGNRAAIRIPAPILSQIGATNGDTVEVDPAAFKAGKPKFALAELLAQCNAEAITPGNMTVWETMAPVGIEVT